MFDSATTFPMLKFQAGAKADKVPRIHMYVCTYIHTYQAWCGRVAPSSRHMGIFSASIGRGMAMSIFCHGSTQPLAALRFLSDVLEHHLPQQDQHKMGEDNKGAQNFPETCRRPRCFPNMLISSGISGLDVEALADSKCPLRVCVDDN